MEEVLRTLQDAGHATYLVGGCVRDLLRGRVPKDWDVATAARPDQVQACFRRVLPTGLQHGTVTVLLRGQHVEVTTFRSEGLYLDGRRPSEVHFETDVREDLGRRDFTINAMAWNPVSREFVDPYGGQRDLEARLVRCVGAPEARFGEDGLRALRAVRFATVLDFALDPPTQAAIAETLPVFRKIALERVTEELRKILGSEQVARGLALLRETGLTGVILPGLQDGPAIDAAVARAPAELESRLAAWLGLAAGPEQLAAHLARLKLPRKLEERTKLLAGALSLGAWVDDSDAQLRRRLMVLKPENVTTAVALGIAAAPVLGLPVADAEQTGGRMERLISERPPLSPAALALDGAAIMRILAIPPSARVGEATRHLMDLVLESPARNTEAELTRALEAWGAAAAPKG